MDALNLCLVMCLFLHPTKAIRKVVLTNGPLWEAKQRLQLTAGIASR